MQPFSTIFHPHLILGSFPFPITARFMTPSESVVWLILDFFLRPLMINLQMTRPLGTGTGTCHGLQR
jgi:hypothetical protein